MTKDRPMRCVIWILAALVAPEGARASTPFFFVDEYIQNTAAIETVRDEAKTELKGDHSTIFADCIRNSEKFKLQLNGTIRVFQSLDLSGNIAKDVVPNLIDLYQQESDLYGKLGSECEKLITPDPAVDYRKLIADAPKITAQIDYVDHLIFKATPLVFATLIDMKPDGQNHLSRLVITRDEKARLVDELNSSFGKKMDETTQNWFVSSATVLRNYLTKKGYKASDEP